MKWTPRIYITLLISFTPRSEHFISMFPSRRISVLSWFMQRPEYVLNNLIVPNRARCDCLSQTNDVMSSANTTNFSLFPFTMMPLIWSLLRTEIASNLRIIIKSNGDSGLPCRTPRLRLKKKESKNHYLLHNSICSYKTLLSMLWRIHQNRKFPEI